MSIDEMIARLQEIQAANPNAFCGEYDAEAFEIVCENMQTGLNN